MVESLQQNKVKSLSGTNRRVSSFISLISFQTNNTVKLTVMHEAISFEEPINGSRCSVIESGITQKRFQFHRIVRLTKLSEKRNLETFLFPEF